MSEQKLVDKKDGIYSFQTIQSAAEKLTKRQVNQAKCELVKKAREFNTCNDKLPQDCMEKMHDLSKKILFQTIIKTVPCTVTLNYPRPGRKIYTRNDTGEVFMEMELCFDDLLLLKVLEKGDDMTDADWIR